MSPLQPWHDFFVLVGTAAATLLGLVFVAASIAASIPNEKLGDARTRTTWVVPIVYSFVRVLIVSAAGVVPGLTERSFGWTLGILGAFDLARMVWVWSGLRHIHRERRPLSWEDWRWYGAYPSGATLLLIITAGSFIAGGPLPHQVLALGIIAHLVIGVRNAWSLASWLAMVR